MKSNVTLNQRYNEFTLYLLLTHIFKYRYNACISSSLSLVTSGQEVQDCPVIGQQFESSSVLLLSVLGECQY